MPGIPVVTITNRSITGFNLSINNLTPDGVDCVGGWDLGTIIRASDGTVYVAQVIPNAQGILTTSVTTNTMADEQLNLVLGTSITPECYSLIFQSTAYTPTLESVSSLKKTIFSKITRGLSYNPRQSQHKKYPTI